MKYVMLILGCSLIVLAALWAFVEFLRHLWDVSSGEPDYTAEEADAFIRGEQPHWPRGGGP